MAELAADNQEAAEAGALTLQQIIEIEASLSDVQRLRMAVFRESLAIWQ